MKSMETTPEILINSSLVTHNDYGESYEFVLNEHLQVVECVRIDSLAEGIINPVEDAESSLEGLLFELNHVRVNPKVDNTCIIDKLTKALENIDVNVSDPASADSMAVCFKPLGEISDNVRFYLRNSGKLVFLSPATRPRLISTGS